MRSNIHDGIELSNNDLFIFIDFKKIQRWKAINFDVTSKQKRSKLWGLLFRLLSTTTTFSSIWFSSSIHVYLFTELLNGNSYENESFELSAMNAIPILCYWTKFFNFETNVVHYWTH